MKIAMISASLSRGGGGVTEVKRRLAQSLVEIPGIQVEVLGLRDHQTEKDLSLWNPFVPNIYDTVGPKAVGFAPRLLAGLKKSNADLVHLHGLWQYPSYAALKGGKPYVTTIHGMLDKWAVQNSKYKKQVAGYLYERGALNKAACLQAFNQQEYEDIRSFGLTNPVCMVPNGVDLPLETEALKTEAPIWKGVIPEGKKVMLYLGRIHQKKGLTNMIKAWKLALEASPSNMKDWALGIVGWDQGGYIQELQQLSNSLHLHESVYFLGPQFNRDKSRAFAHASAFILPSFSEGLPMAVLEAWSYSLPVLITKHCNLPEGLQHGAALPINPEINSIAEGLEKMASLTDPQRAAMGAAGFNLVKEKFDWKSVAQSMHGVYKWIAELGPMPDNIVLK
jgi:poly(glycerol-phosphate) alpha-glucosyltransferase